MPQIRVSIGLFAILAFSLSVVCSKETTPETSQAPHVIDNIMNTLDHRETWPSNGVKIWLKNPTIIVSRRLPAGAPVIVHAWARNENDFNVPMIRINSGDTLYQISVEEYGKLSELNEKK